MKSGVGVHDVRTWAWQKAKMKSLIVNSTILHHFKIIILDKNFIVHVKYFSVKFEERKRTRTLQPDQLQQ